MSDLDLLAEEVAVSGRTLRRAASRGTIRCVRPSERRIVVPPREYDYVRSHWRLIGRVLEILRTAPSVRLAVLFGSVARGEDVGESDLDLLVHLLPDGVLPRAALRERLEAVLARRVQLVGLPEAEQSSLLLADVLREGRVLIDRDQSWRRLERRAREIERQAREEDRQLDDEAWSILERLEG